jgi:hypothetical protein
MTRDSERRAADRRARHAEFFRWVAEGNRRSKAQQVVQKMRDAFEAADTAEEAKAAIDKIATETPGVDAFGNWLDPSFDISR